MGTTERSPVPGADVDVAVIGAGVVGLAVASAISEHRSLAVIERNDSFGCENSSHNSGVIHAGIYHPPDWLKTTLCREGNTLIYQWAEENGVRFRRCGKLVVAVKRDEVAALEDLLAAARANGVPELSLIDEDEVRRLEPSVRAAAAIVSGSSGVIDQMGLMASFLERVRANGGYVAFRHNLVGLKRETDGFLLYVQGPDRKEHTLAAAVVVNSAGLASDRVGVLLGYDPGGSSQTPAFRQVLNKGRYYDLAPTDDHRGINHLVYPLPRSDRTALGIHLTVDVDGQLHLGPDEEWLESGCQPDFQPDDRRRAKFVAEAGRYLPNISADELTPGQVGYRPKLHREGEPERDFLIWSDQGYVHLGGIESPGLTASLAIARHVSGLL